MLGKKLKKTRERLGLSQKDAAGQIGISPVTLCKIEKDGDCGRQGTRDKINAWIEKKQAQIDKADAKSENKAGRLIVKDEKVIRQKAVPVASASSAPSVESEVPCATRAEYLAKATAAFVETRERLMAVMEYTKTTMAKLSDTFEELNKLLK